MSKEFPDDPDIAFNAGWAKLSDGRLQEGYKLLDKGRETTVWEDCPDNACESGSEAAKEASK